MINDPEFILWQQYGVRAWPTVILIDPTSKRSGYQSGEGVYDGLQPAIKGMIAEFDAQKLMDRTVLTFTPKTAVSTSGLKFPAKVFADVPGKRLIISDTNQNWVIVANLNDYTIQAVIGGMDAGLVDGDFTTARFNWPHGVTVQGDKLYVADTGIDALREVDLVSGKVTTLAGTGAQNRDFLNIGGDGLQTALNSPWDVVVKDNLLYIAMAGPHQLWSFDLAMERG